MYPDKNFIQTILGIHLIEILKDKSFNFLKKTIDLNKHFTKRNTRMAMKHIERC